MAGTRLAVQVYFFVTILLLGLPLAAWFEFVPRGSRLPPPEAIAAGSYGRATERVKRYIVQCYLRGADVGCAERAELEGSTFVATKRRIRDRWNRTLVRRVPLPTKSS